MARAIRTATSLGRHFDVLTKHLSRSRVDRLREKQDRDRDQVYPRDSKPVRRGHDHGAKQPSQKPGYEYRFVFPVLLERRPAEEENPTDANSRSEVRVVHRRPQASPQGSVRFSRRRT